MLEPSLFGHRFRCARSPHSGELGYHRAVRSAFGNETAVMVSEKTRQFRFESRIMDCGHSRYPERTSKFKSLVQSRRYSPLGSRGCDRRAILLVSIAAALQCLSNAVSLTTPAIARAFCFAYHSIRAHPCGGARTASVCVASIHLRHPNLLGPSVFINSVLPTNHLFDHHRP